MQASPSCVGTFHLPRKNWNAGEELTGEFVFFVINAIQNIRAIDISFSGVESIDNECLVDKRKRIFEKKQITLLAAGDNNALSVKEGEHIWKFSFPIPSNIPPTMDPSFMRVVFKLTATVRSQDHTVKNLRYYCYPNMNAGATYLSQDSIENGEYTLKKKFLFEPEEGLTLTAKMENRLLRPGEPINVHIELHNTTSRQVKSVVIKVKTKVECFAGLTRKTNFEVPCSEPFVFPLENGSWNYDYSTSLPKRMLPSVNFSTFLKVSHYITINLKLFANSVKLRIPYFVEFHPK